MGHRNTGEENTVATMTLEQLKEENADEATKQDDPELQPDAEGGEAGAATTDESTDNPEGADTTGADAEGAEVETWMHGDEQGSPDQPRFTDSDVAAAKRKLKAKLTKKDDEIADLRQQLDELKTGRATQTQSASTTSPPTLEGCDFDEVKYQTEMAKWAESLVDSKLATHTETVQKTQSQKQAEQKLNEAVDSHYGRAAKLVEDGLVTVDEYHNADALVRSSLDQVMPGSGDMLADTLISRLGDGSEKVMFHLARNEAARMTLLSKFSSDPLGLEAMVYLGELKKDITTPKKRVSDAPAPGADLQPDSDTNTNVKALKRRYDQAVKGGSIQDRISIRRQAKAAGHDISNW